MIRDAPHPTPGCQDLLPSRPHWPPVWGRKVTTGHRQATSRRTLASPCLLSQEGPSPAAPSPPRPPPQPPTPTGALQEGPAPPQQRSLCVDVPSTGWQPCLPPARFPKQRKEVGGACERVRVTVSAGNPLGLDL